MKITPFDKGIEEILWEEEISAERLPDLFSLIPSESPVESYLQEIFYSPSLEEHILASLRPELSHREITIPARFQTIAEETCEILRETLKQTDSPAKEAALQKAVHLLEEQRELRGLLSAYRKLLMEG
jgi:hypothetical protein